MSVMMGLAALQFGLQAYSIIEGAKNSKEMADLKRGDIALQKESLKLSKEARELQVELAEAKVRRDMRRAQAKMLARSAISGVTNSSIGKAMTEGMTAELESGISSQRELSGIQDSQSDIQEQRLSIAANMVTETSDLDQILNISGAGISAGMTGYMAYKYRKQPKLETEMWTPDYDMTEHPAYKGN